MKLKIIDITSKLTVITKNLERRYHGIRVKELNGDIVYKLEDDISQDTPDIEIAFLKDLENELSSIFKNLKGTEF